MNMAPSAPLVAPANRRAPLRVAESLELRKTVEGLQSKTSQLLMESFKSSSILNSFGSYETLISEPGMLAEFRVFIIYRST